MGLGAPLDSSKTNNSSETPNCHKNLEMISFKIVNQLTMKRETTEPTLLPLHSTILRGKQIHMSDLDKAHRKFSITTEENFQNK